MYFMRYSGQKDIYLANYVHGETIYCEPFSGSYKTGYNLMQQGIHTDYVYNDIDLDLCKLIWFVQNKSDELINTIQRILNNMYSLYCATDDFIDIYLERLYKTNSNINQAAIKYILLNGETVRRRFNIYNVNKYFDKLKQMNENGCLELLYGMKIYNLNFDKCISYFDSKNTFFLIDPPYYNTGFEYKNNFIYHYGLYKSILKIKGRFILYYNDCNFIHDLYNQFNVYELGYKYGRCKECIISNIDIDVNEIGVG